MIILPIERGSTIRPGDLLVLNPDGTLRESTSTKIPQYIAMETLLHKTHGMVAVVRELTKQERYAHLCGKALSSGPTAEECKNKFVSVVISNDTSRIAHDILQQVHERLNRSSPVSVQHDAATRSHTFRLACNKCHDVRNANVDHDTIVQDPIKSIVERLIEQLQCCPTVWIERAIKKQEQLRQEGCWRDFLNKGEGAAVAVIRATGEGIINYTPSGDGYGAYHTCGHTELINCVFVAERLAGHYLMRPVGNDTLGEEFVVSEAQIKAGKILLRAPYSRDIRMATQAWKRYWESQRSHHWDPYEGY